MLKTILDHILNEDRLNLFFQSLLWLGPVLGLVTGIISGIPGRTIRKHTLRGLGIGLLASFVSVMWYLYNAIMNYYGLDSVKGLLINLAFFAAMGIATGIFFRIVLCKKKQN
jgi:hypothetical protein